MIIDHVGITVSDFERSKKFYGDILAPLGIVLIKEEKQWAGFGANNKPEFWFGEGRTKQYFSHVTFAAKTEKEVDDFYTAAIKAGALCNGKPKHRSNYYPQHYGAFIIDLDGHYIGAVLHV